jgi:hypothetical protein
METDMSDTENTAARIHADALHKIAELEDALAAERAKVEAIAMKEAISAQASGLFAHGLKLETELESLRSKLDAAEAVVRAAQEMSQAIYNEEAKQTWLISKPLRFHEAINNLRAALSRQEGGQG